MRRMESEQVPPFRGARPELPLRARGFRFAAVATPLGKEGTTGSTSATLGGTCFSKNGGDPRCPKATFAGHFQAFRPATAGFISRTGTSGKNAAKERVKA